MQRNKAFLILFISIHLSIAAAFSIAGIIRKNCININADLFSMIPDTTENSAFRTADNRISGNTQNSIFILSVNKNFEIAKQNAITAYDSLKASDNYSQYFENLSLYNSNESFQEISDFLQKYRWNFLSEEAIQNLSNSQGRQEFSENALSQLYSGFTLSSLENLDDDPFLIEEYNLRKFLKLLSDTGTNMSPKSDVLATKFEDNWYVMLQGTLTKKGATLASKKNGIQLIYDTLLPLENENCRFVFSGTSFHSHKSSTSANREISLISTISMLAVLLMLIFVFRSPLPIFASFGSILLSITTAFLVTQTIFGQLHVLTLIFGTSLIGSCIDYSLHFFVNWKSNSTLKNGSQIRSFLAKGLTLSLLSTELCYFLLIFAPFVLLKQMAVFSFSGILSSFITVMLFFPLIKKDDENLHSRHNSKHFPAQRTNNFIIFAQKIAGFANAAVTWHKPILSALMLVLLATLFINRSNLKIHNNLSALYKMQGRLKADTIESAKVLNYTSSSWFIIKGNSAQQLLQNEEEFALQFESQAKTTGFLCTSRFIPSMQKQENSIAACKLLMQDAEEQFAAIGYETPEVSAQAAIQKMAEENIIFDVTLVHLPSQLKNLQQMLWLGEIDGNFYSLFLPTTYIQPELCTKLANQNPNVTFENKVQQIGSVLDNLSVMILKMFGIAFILICIILKFFFTAKQTAKIAVVPAFSVLCIASVFAATKTPLDFFCVTGMILVFGLGIDYIIYMTQHNGGKLERKAILLSFLTTAISFGTLALSSFVPVHVIGLSIFSGLVAAFIATMLL